MNIHLLCFPGDGPDGGSAAWHHSRVFPRHYSAPGWRCAGIYSAPAGGARQRLLGQVPEWPGHLQLLRGAARETGEVAAWGERATSVIGLWLLSGEVQFFGCPHPGHCILQCSTLGNWNETANLTVGSSSLARNRVVVSYYSRGRLQLSSVCTTLSYITLTLAENAAVGGAQHHIHGPTLPLWTVSSSSISTQWCHSCLNQCSGLFCLFTHPAAGMLVIILSLATKRVWGNDIRCHMVNVWLWSSGLNENNLLFLMVFFFMKHTFTRWVRAGLKWKKCQIRIWRHIYCRSVVYRFGNKSECLKETTLIKWKEEIINRNEM